ncbi:MAG: methyltransferase domain-containing protein [Desulfofustis sp.]
MKRFDWDSRDYEKHSASQQKWARELITRLSLEGTERLLDIGCGDGKVTAEIAAILKDGSVVGIDSSESMIQLARKRYPASRYPNLIFVLMDAVSLRFQNRFDVVFSNAALHWVKDHRPVVEAIYQCLKPGGRIVLQMGGTGNARTLIGVMEELTAHPSWSGWFEDFEFPYGFLAADDYLQLLNEAGFADSSAELIEKDMVHDGEDGLKGWIRTTWLPYTQRLPERLRDEFIDLVAARYLELEPLDASGKAHVDMVRLQAEARKPGK